MAAPFHYMTSSHVLAHCNWPGYDAWLMPSDASDHVEVQSYLVKRKHVHEIEV